jgi:hypothetical protein
MNHIEWLKDTGIYEVRYELAAEQGITDVKEIELFALAMVEEYYNLDFLSTEALYYRDMMMDVYGKPIYHPEFDIKNPDEPVDDFIVGKVLKQDDYTIIKSDERLPQRFYKKDVEIRLTIIPKKPMKDVVEGIITEGGYTDGGYNFSGGYVYSIPHVVGKGTVLHKNILSKYEGKKVKIIIEELPE